jgi:hypothetical protein
MRVFIFLVMLSTFFTCQTEKPSFGIMHLIWVNKFPIDTIKKEPEIIEVPEEIDLRKQIELDKMENKAYLDKIQRERYALGYNFYLLLCDDCEALSLPEAVAIQKIVKEQPYQVRQKNTPDSLYIDFTFITSCCQEHFGVAKVKKDTLKLYYAQSDLDMCLCYCAYNYRFALAKSKFYNKVKYVDFKKTILMP